MMHLGLVQSIRAEWTQSDVVSKAVIIVALLLVIFAYLPTLQFDYLTQDQWRAFRYSTDGEPALLRGKVCGVTVWKFYVQTGRPFIWFTECIEHAAVSQISDLRYVRPFALVIVILSTIYIGAVLAPFLSGLALGISAAAAFVFAPGYSFMYLQGMTAGMVLISVLLATASFQQLRISEQKESYTEKIRPVLCSGLLFVSACLIYPAYAFVVIPLTLIEFSFHASRSLLLRIKVLLAQLTCYFIASISYYGIVKLSVMALEIWNGRLQSLGMYDVAVQSTPSIIAGRIVECIQYFSSMPPLNFEAPGGFTVILVAGASAVAALNSRVAHKPIGVVTGAVVAFFVNGSVLLASISPWLLSNMNGLATRHLLAWYLFFCASAVALLALVLSRVVKLKANWLPVAVLLGVLVPVAVSQHRLTSLEVMVAGLEIQTMRERISDWIESRGWLHTRYFLAILPTRPRPTIVEPSYPNLGSGDINAVLSSSQSPASVPWMLNAVLRERPDRPSLRLIDCSIDQVCANAAAQDQKVMVVGYTNGMSAINSTVDPHVINFSVLTSSPVTPSITRVKGPTITASSMYKELGPYGLLSAMNPGWHSERRPSYPQTLDVDLEDERTFNKVKFLPQDDFLSRMPDSVEVSVRSENGSWSVKGLFHNLCDTAEADGWHTLRLDHPVKSRFIRLNIIRNCGDAELLTLRGLRFE